MLYFVDNKWFIRLLCAFLYWFSVTFSGKKSGRNNNDRDRFWGATCDFQSWRSDGGFRTLPISCDVRTLLHRDVLSPADGLVYRRMVGWRIGAVHTYLYMERSAASEVLYSDGGIPCFWVRYRGGCVRCVFGFAMIGRCDGFWSGEEGSIFWNIRCGRQ